MTNLALRLVEKDTMDKQKALEAALGQIERSYGKGSIMKLGQQTAVEVEAVPTGSLGLDIGARTATARWLGEPVDYDHALLVLMAAWDAGHHPPRPGSSLPA